jgi:tetratricopeptide (TPR) repeat protein
VESEELQPAATPTPQPTTHGGAGGQGATAAPAPLAPPATPTAPVAAAAPTVTEAQAEERYAAGDLEGAAAIYRQLGVANADVNQRMRLLVSAAWLEQQQGHTEDAASILHQGLLDAPDYAFQPQNYSQDFVDLYLKAKERAVSERKQRAADLVRRSLQEMASEDLPRARATLVQALALAPDDPFALYDAALVELKANRHDAAVAGFERLLALEATHPGSLPTEVKASASASLGLLYYQKDFLDDAKRYLEQAVTLDPSAERAWNNLGLTLRKAGDLEGAERAFKKAIELQPDDTQVASNLALLYIARQRWSDAITLLGTTAARAPNDAFTWLNLGLAQRGAGDANAAVTSLQKVIALDPDNKQGYAERAASYLSVVHFERKDAAAATAAARQATAWDPRDVDAWVYLGLAQNAQGDFPGARESLQHAATLDPARADVQNNLGTVLVASGDLAGAEAAFRQALTLKPGFAEAQANLDQVLLRQVAAKPPNAATGGHPAPAHRRQPKFIGVTFSDTDFTYLGIRGAVVESVQGESPAERGGLRKGDVVLGVDGKAVGGPQQLLKYLREYSGERDYVEMDILRDGQPRRLRIEMF